MSELERLSHAELAARVEVADREIAGLRAENAGLVALVEARAVREQEQDRVITELRALVAELQGEVAALRRQVGRDSSNSSQPPGRDGPSARAGRRPRSGGGRSRGGQPGRRGAAWSGPRSRTRCARSSRRCAAGAAPAWRAPPVRSPPLPRCSTYPRWRCPWWSTR